MFAFMTRKCWQFIVKFCDLDVLTKLPYVVYKYFYSVLCDHTCV